MQRIWTPTRAAGLARLAAFAPHAGRDYAAGRNTDPGPDRAAAVSGLSPYLRRRLVTEQEVATAALNACGQASEKFVQEVFWRTYFKGFLEQHPAIWTRYRADVGHGWNRLATEGGLSRVFADATEGRCGIEGFDDWARELVATNWLHNHARMWFASIWIFTLRLPWALGADFFARHLLDGDPASNTLSWRWVAGLHTRGKAYVARADNIARYTEGRFFPKGVLDEAPEPLSDDWSPSRIDAPVAAPPPSGDVALLLHDDDCAPESLDLGSATVRAVAGFSAAASLAYRGVVPAVAEFAGAAVADALARAAERFGCAAVMLAPDAVAGWVRASSWPVVTPYAPVGPAAECLRTMVPDRLIRGWDRAAWPHAARGFFQLRARIPELLEAVSSAA